MWRRVASQSPVSPDEADQAYVKAFAALSQLLREGRSFSGNERNGCFLNTGGQRFATVSTASGFSFADDGRALGLTDWDQDGDLDVWVSNRTGPRLRFLRNESVGGHFVSFQLEGTNSNRDAIGARLELYVQSSSNAPSDSPRVQEVGAGAGFLSQGSKRLHFGLRDDEQIDHVLIHWPSGEREQITNVERDQRYRIRQGSGRADPQADRSPSVALSPRVLEGDPVSNVARIVVSGRLPMPAIRSREIQPDRLNRDSGPLWVNLWSTTCVPCLTELAELTEREDEIRQRGLRVIALNVDELSADSADAEWTASREILTRIGFPFAAAAIDNEMAGTLDIFHRAFLSLRRPLPLPSSFLTTADGQVAVIYRGPVSVQRVLDDLPLLDLSPKALRMASVPFEGQWALRQARVDPKPQATEFMRSGFVDAGVRYLERFLTSFLSGSGGWGPRELWPTRQQMAELCEPLADFYRLRNEPTGVMKAYELAVRINPRFVAAYVMLGKSYLRLGRADEGLKMLERARQLDPASATVAIDLAVGYAMAGKLQEARALFEQQLEQNPERVQPHLYLARLAKQRSDNADAIAHYRAFVQERPSAAEAMAPLAWILVTTPDESLRDVVYAQELIRRLDAVGDALGDDQGQYDEVRAAVAAEAGDFQHAVQFIKQALNASQADGDLQRTSRLLTQQEQYEQGKPLAPSP